MNGKLVFAFLLTIATLLSNTLATPVVNNVQTPPLDCKIPCRNTRTGKVCGNNGVTYDDIGFITCRQMCGEPICKAYDGECTVPPKKKVVCK